jgi:hypothetical protein
VLSLQACTRRIPKGGRPRLKRSKYSEPLPGVNAEWPGEVESPEGLVRHEETS